ncbi:MAG: diphthine--ammonia ligase [Candidatus Micrarchaeales archaeon]|nr:diphthine--ammonia ligase [Candidatus Micrarchaeales archaeon]
MLAALYSGGKDSTLAIHRMWEQGKRVELLITLVSENKFSYMLQRINVNWTALQAQAMGVKHAFYNTKGEKEKELVDIEDALKKYKVTELVTGAVASKYQADRINRICDGLGITHYSPLWGMDPLMELGEISAKFNAIVTQVAAEGFDDSMLGARIDERLIGKLQTLHRKYRINMSFEGGEAESFVLDAPLFKKRIVINKARKEWNGSVGAYIIEEAELAEK